MDPPYSAPPIDLIFFVDILYFFQMNAIAEIWKKTFVLISEKRKQMRNLPFCPDNMKKPVDFLTGFGMYFFDFFFVLIF
jgi:hypothetical protein